MIRINLQPRKETERQLGQRQQRDLALLGLAVVALIMFVPWFIQGRRLAALDNEIEQVKAEITRYDAQVKEVRDLDALKTELKAKLQVIHDLNEKRVGPARLLNGLSISAPDNLWLVDFRENNGEATLTGMALDNQTIAAFMRQLQGSPYFYNVDLVETTQRGPSIRPGARPLPESFKRFIVKARIDYFGRGGKPATDGDGKAAGQPGQAKPAPAAAPVPPRAG